MCVARRRACHHDDVMAEERAVLVAWLARTRPAEPIEVVETHISVVALQGDRAYKLKKPVRFAFVDLSTPELREADCRREVELNRRFAPDVYLGVTPLTDASGGVVDHVVEMRRLPESRRLSVLAGEPDGGGACVDALARALASAHAHAPTGGEIDDAVSADAISELWELGIAQLAPYEDEVVSSEVAQCVATAARSYIAGRGSLFAARIAQGRARDGHGDLLADDVFCLDDGPRAIDCLEFDDRLRYCDTLADAAFLAMDLERLQRPDLAKMFLETHRRATGDDWPVTLAHFYVAYRAHVRAKVACLRFTQGDEGASALARQLVALAHAHLDEGRVRLVLVGGAPGSGKTTLAADIARRTGWQVFHSDDVRKELAGAGRAHELDGRLDEGIYTPAITDQTYDRLLALAREALGLGRCVVLDASWSDRSRRADARAAALELSSDLIAIECAAPEATRVERAAQRAVRGTDSSDAGPSIARALGVRFEPWPDAIRIDTTPPADVVSGQALSHLRAPGCEHAT
jgi:aminoglycoside phosphotransferase family enzyme/predicted kinase